MPSKKKFSLVINKITKADLGTLPGGTSSTAFDINSAGVIVGEGTSASGITHAFVISGANRFDLSGSPNGPYSSARGINNLGQVVGERQVINSAGNSVHHGFVWKNGVMRDLGASQANDSAGLSESIARRINNNGLIAGSIGLSGVVWDLSGTPKFPPFPLIITVKNPGTLLPKAVYDINNAGRAVGTLISGEVAFRWKAGVFTFLKQFGAGWSDEAFGVNQAGWAVGEGRLFQVTPIGTHAVLWPLRGNPIDLGTLGGKESTARDINDKGFVVGSSDTASGARHAFIWHTDLGMQSLGTLGGANSDAFAINAAGQIVGASQTAAGERHATLWEVHFA